MLPQDCITGNYQVRLLGGGEVVMPASELLDLRWEIGDKS